jgi:hypothetical protein
LLVIAAALAVCGAAAADVATSVLPPGEAISAQREQPRSFNPQNLYEYIDGAADLFLSYGFEDLVTAAYDLGEEHAITVDVYDMAAPLNAFGVFMSERPERTPSLALGAQGYFANGLLAFWKGRYYVKISGLESDEAVERTLAAATAERLSGPTALPAEFAQLPAKGRVPGSERYVRKDALGHKALTNVISADYTVGKATVTLHLADLLTPAQAEQAWEKLRDFEKRSGTAFAEVSGIGDSGFAARDSGYGEMVVALAGRFVVISTSEKAGRGAVQEMAETTLGDRVREPLRWRTSDKPAA